MRKDDEKTGGAQEETLRWLQARLAGVSSELDDLVRELRRGGGWDAEERMARMENDVRAYRAKVEFEKRNLPGGGR